MYIFALYLLTYEANKIKVFNDRSAYHSFHQLYGQRA